MANNKQDPLIESLMALAVSAAPLIRRARESGIFKDMATRPAEEDIVEATVVKTPEAPAAAAADTSALEGILVRQAMRIAELEAEIAVLTAKAAAKPAPKPKAAAKKRPAK